MKEKQKKNKKKQDKKTSDLNKCNEWVNKKEADTSKELFKQHFNFQRPSDMLKLLHTTKNKTKNNELVSVINSGLKELKEEIKKMSEDEKKLRTQIKY